MLKHPPRPRFVLCSSVRAARHLGQALRCDRGLEDVVDCRQACKGACPLLLLQSPSGPRMSPQLVKRGPARNAAMSSLRTAILPASTLNQAHLLFGSG